MRHVLACAIVVALGIAPAAAGQTDPSDSVFLVDPSNPDRRDTDLWVLTRNPIARVSISVPHGYTLDLGRRPGAEVGDAVVFTRDAAGGSLDNESASITVADAGAYATDPHARSCAPGWHAAVWKAVLSGPGGRSLELTIFVDPVGSGAATGAAYVLTTCPVWRSAQIGVAHRAAAGLIITLARGITRPSAAGHYRWSALVTPAEPSSLSAEAGRAFELRATVPSPRILTLRARHDLKSKAVVLTGRLVALGSPEGNVPIVLFTTGNDGGPVGYVRTDASGEFRLRARVRREATIYLAEVRELPRPCSAPSSAPGGCLSETVTPPRLAGAGKVFREATDPKLDVPARENALARRATLMLRDLPDGWRASPLANPLDLCLDVKPDLSALTTTGEAHSPLLHTRTSSAYSTAAVYATGAEARTAFRRQAQRRIARCVAGEGEGGTVVRRLAKVPFPRLGQDTRVYRVVVRDDREAVFNLDQISIRRGRVVVHIWLASADRPLEALARSLSAKLASRAAGG